MDGLSYFAVTSPSYDLFYLIIVSNFPLLLCLLISLRYATSSTLLLLRFLGSLNIFCARRMRIWGWQRLLLIAAINSNKYVKWKGVSNVARKDNLTNLSKFLKVPSANYYRLKIRQLFVVCNNLIIDFDETLIKIQIYNCNGRLYRWHTFHLSGNQKYANVNRWHEEACVCIDAHQLEGEVKLAHSHSVYQAAIRWMFLSDRVNFGGIKGAVWVCSLCESFDSTS